jgi:hypothetical protein
MEKKMRNGDVVAGLLAVKELEIKLLKEQVYLLKVRNNDLIQENLLLDAYIQKIEGAPETKKKISFKH